MRLPRYIINFDELTDELKKQILDLINKELNKSLFDKSQMDIEDVLKHVRNKISKNKYEDIIYKINGLVIEEIRGKQKIEGRILIVPAMRGDYKRIFKFDKDVYLTGVHVNQTGWKKEDKYTLEVNENKIIESYTKEIGEHKYFERYFKINANTPISFVLNNISGNSRQVMIDLEYLESEV